jgi:hypothetical protein
MTSSRAEHRVHDIFSQVDLPGWTAIHSLGVASHRFKRWGEIDFLIVGPSGVLVLEVKGGRVARSSDGIWEFKDGRDEVTRKVEGPFQQASSGLMELKVWLEEQLPSPVLEPVSWGYGVLFPDITFGQKSPEWARETVADENDLRSVADAQRWLQQLTAYWQKKTNRRQPLERKSQSAILTLLRGEFEYVHSLATLAQRAIEASNRLTEEQMWLVDLVPDNPRIIVEGGAGTGKTFMAAEVARRLDATGVGAVGIVVPRDNAALPYRGVLPPGVPVITPARWATAPQVDVIIGDEAQDLLSEEGLVALDRLVHGGLSGGRWVLFLDPNEQARFRQILDPTALELVRGLATVRVPLRRNLRNTFEIVKSVQESTNADIGVAGGGHGPDAVVQILESEADFVAAAQHLLERLAAQHVPADEVVVITWGDPASVATALNKRPYPTVLLRDDAGFVPPRGALIVSDPGSFQGLEATNALLGPVPSPDSFSAVSSIYVAMTRARATLWYFMTASAAEAFASRSKFRATAVDQA